MKRSVRQCWTPLRTPLVALIAQVVCLAILVPLLAPARAGAQDAERFEVLDGELIEALSDSDLLSSWYRLSPVDPTLAMVRVLDPVELTYRDELEIVMPSEAREALLENALALSESAELILDTSRLLLSTEAQLIGVKNMLQLRHTEVTAARTERRQTERERNRLLDDLAVVEEAIRATAVAAYMGDQTPAISNLDNVAAYNDAARLELTVATAMDRLLATQDLIQANIDELDTRLTELDTSIATLSTQIDDLTEQETSLIGAIAKLTEQLEELQDETAELRDATDDLMVASHQARMLGIVEHLEAPLVALDAYVRAANHVPKVKLGCGLRWQMLAGIAKVETGHGTFLGTELLPDGHTTKRILGPLLDGSVDGTAIIGDTDAGTLDGDPNFDAAVGPFQFIPSTWKFFDWDGDGDQIANPHNIYDGAMSAAVYLCTSGSMDSPGEIAAGVLSYNESQEYLELTTAFADHYSEMLLPGPGDLPTFEDEGSGLDDNSGDSDSGWPNTDDSNAEPTEPTGPPFGRGTLPVPPPPSEIAQSKVTPRPPPAPGEEDTQPPTDDETPPGTDTGNGSENRDPGDPIATDDSGTSGDSGEGDGTSTGPPADTPTDTPPETDTPTNSDGG